MSPPPPPIQSVSQFITADEMHRDCSRKDDSHGSNIKVTAESKQLSCMVNIGTLEPVLKRMHSNSPYENRSRMFFSFLASVPEHYHICTYGDYAFYSTRRTGQEG